VEPFLKKIDDLIKSKTKKINREPVIRILSQIIHIPQVFSTKKQNLKIDISFSNFLKKHRDIEV
jgi:hypothetical protein